MSKTGGNFTDDENTGQGGNMVPSSSSKPVPDGKSERFRDDSDRSTDNNDYTQPDPTVRRPG